MQILYCYFRYAGRLFLGCALFVAGCNTIRKSWETKKERLSYRKKYIEEFVWGISLFWLHACLFLAFFVYFLPLPTCGMAAIKIHILLWVVFYVMTSWINGRKYENLKFNTTHFFYKQRFFSTHPHCCLAFSWIELQMFLRCGLIHITIIIPLYILYFILSIFLSKVKLF